MNQWIIYCVQTQCIYRCTKYLKGIRKQSGLTSLYCTILFDSSLLWDAFFIDSFILSFSRSTLERESYFFCIFSFLPQSTFKYNVCVVFTQKTFWLSLKLLLKALLQEGLETLDQMHFYYIHIEIYSTLKYGKTKLRFREGL